MARNPSDDFIKEKNQEVNAPIRLYRIVINPDAASGETSEIFLAEYSEDVEYFKDVNTPQTYLKFPIRLEEISENSEGQIDSVTIIISNVSREIQAFLELYDGLRGNKVTIRQVFADYLDDPQAYIEDIFYIDTATSNQDTVQFTLSSKLDILNVVVPSRKFYRNHCSWQYKGEGCWLLNDAGDGWEAPTNFSATLTNLMGGNYEIFDIGTATVAAQAERNFWTVNCKGLDKTSDSLVIDLKCNDPSRLSSNGALEITSSGTMDVNEWEYQDLTGLGITVGWKTFTIPLADFTHGDGLLDVEDINYIRWWNYATAGINLIISWRSPRVTTADSCNKTLESCGRHNNKERFGGFPGVPKRKVIRM